MVSEHLLNLGRTDQKKKNIFSKDCKPYYFIVRIQQINNIRLINEIYQHLEWSNEQIKIHINLNCNKYWLEHTNIWYKRKLSNRSNQKTHRHKSHVSASFRICYQNILAKVIILEVKNKIQVFLRLIRSLYSCFLGAPVVQATSTLPGI